MVTTIPRAGRGPTISSHLNGGLGAWAPLPNLRTCTDQQDLGGRLTRVYQKS
jgi:hypothetical protein